MMLFSRRPPYSLRPYRNYKVLKRFTSFWEGFFGLRPYRNYKVLKRIHLLYPCNLCLRPYRNYKVLKLDVKQTARAPV